MAGRGLRAFLGLGALMMALAILPVSAAMAASPNLEWTPPTYDFGSVTYGTGPSEPREFTLTNTGENRVVIQNWRYRNVEAWPEAGDPFWSPNATSTPCLVTSRSLEPGESCSIEIVFDPLHPGNWWSEVRVRGEGEELWSELLVSGKGVGPWVPVTPSHLAFGSATVGVTTMPQTVVVENQDPTNLTIEGISTTGLLAGAGLPLPSPFRVVGGTCQVGGSLAPGKTCTIEVVMAPTEPGALRSTLEISDSAPDSPQSVELEGSAAAVPGTGQPVNQEGTATVASPTTAATTAPSPATTPSPSPVKRACPRGKRRTTKNGQWVCVKRHGPRRNAARGKR